VKSNQSSHILFVFLGAIILLLIIAPLAGLFLSTSGIELFETAKDPEVIESIRLTIVVSFVATLFSAVFAIPLSYILARNKFPGREIINSIVDLPIVIPHSAAGIAILGFISRDSVVGSMADAIGLNFIGHPVGIGLAMAFVSVPFLINSARDGFSMVPDKLEKAALNLGASPIRVFFTVSLPLTWRHIISGAIMMFARGMSEFGAVVIVAYHPMITPVLIYERFGAFGLKYARPLAAVFISICLLFFIILRLLSSKRFAER
jgi:molybdate/tungstate transport system permease protein